MVHCGGPSRFVDNNGPPFVQNEVLPNALLHDDVSICRRLNFGLPHRVEG